MRLLYPVADLLLDCISLLVQDDTPAIVVTTFEELHRVLSSDIQIVNRKDDPYQFGACVDPSGADDKLFEALQCSSRDQLINLSESCFKHICSIILLAEKEIKGNNG